jgi:hypothetical protein
LCAIAYSHRISLRLNCMLNTGGLDKKEEECEPDTYLSRGEPPCARLQTAQSMWTAHHTMHSRHNEYEPDS